MECTPTPATAGLKLPPLTPVPLYVPPAGLPPLSAKAASEVVMPVMLPGQVTVGSGFTVMVKEQLLVQLLPSVML